MIRFRITTTPPGAAEQTWVLLPDEAAARMQAEELARQEKLTHVRVYREDYGPVETRELVFEVTPRKQ